MGVESAAGCGKAATSFGMGYRYRKMRNLPGCFFHPGKDMQIPTKIVDFVINYLRSRLWKKKILGALMLRY